MLQIYFLSRSVHFLDIDYLQLQGHDVFCERTLVNEGWLEEPMKYVYNIRSIFTSYTSFSFNSID